MTAAAVLSTLVQVKGVEAATAKLNALDAAGRKAGAGIDQAAARHARGAKVIKGGALLAATALAGAAKVAADYEQSMNTLQAVSGATDREMKKLGKAAIQLGADTKLPGTSAADAAVAMTELAKGGLSVKDTMKAARGVLQLSAAAQIGNAEAATITARALNTFGLKGKEATRVADLLAATSNASTAEIGDIAMAMQQAGASAQQMGIPIEDLTTAIGLMANAGVVGSDAGTSLKTMFSRLIPETNKQAEAMKRFGIDVFDNNGKFIGLGKTIDVYRKALGPLKDEQQAAALKILFGSDAQRAANIVLLGGAKAFDKMKDAATRSRAAQDLAGAKTKGFKGALEGFKSQLETTGVAVGTKLLPPLTSALRAVTKFIGAVSDGKKPAVALAGVLGTLAAGFAFAGVVNTLSKAIGGLATAWRLLNLAFVTSPLGATILAIGALAAALIYAYRHSEKFRSVVQAAFIGALKVVTKVIDLFLSQITTFLDGLHAVLEAASHIPGVGGAFKKAAEGVQVAADKINHLREGIRAVPRNIEIAIRLQGVEAAAQKIASLMRAGKSVPLLRSTPKQTPAPTGGGGPKGHGATAKASAAMASAASAAKRAAELLFPLEDRLEKLRQKHEQLQASFASADQQGRLFALRKKAGGGDKDARKELADLRQEIARTKALAKIDLQIQGIEKAKAMRDALASIGTTLRDNVSTAVAKFREEWQKAGGAAFDAQTEAMLAGLPAAQELAALRATQDASEKAAEDKRLADKLTAAQASGDAIALLEAQAEIETVNRQRRITALEAQVASERERIQAERAAERQRLEDAEAAAFEKRLQRSLDAEFEQLKKRKQTYAKFVKDVAKLLEPLGIIFESSPDAQQALGAFKKARGYASGTAHADRGWAWVGERGPELVNFRGGETVHSNGESNRSLRELLASERRGVVIHQTNHMLTPDSPAVMRRVAQAAAAGFGLEGFVTSPRHVSGI